MSMLLFTQAENNGSCKKETPESTILGQISWEIMLPLSLR